MIRHDVNAHEQLSQNSKWALKITIFLPKVRHFGNLPVAKSALFWQSILAEVTYFRQIFAEITIFRQVRNFGVTQQPKGTWL